MPIKDREKRRAYNVAKLREHYRKNKATYRAKNKERMAALFAVAVGLKDRPCADCGGRFPHVCMDFDHVRGTKVCNLSYATRLGWSQTRFLAEANKCEVVCSNCHRIRTARRAGHLR